VLKNNIKKIFLVSFLTVNGLMANEPLFSRQWGLKNVGQSIFKNISDLERVKIIGTPGIDVEFIETESINSVEKEIIVAVLDSGIDLDHPEFKNKIWYNESLCKNAPNAKNLACQGYNFLDNNTNLSDDVGHGTHVAGIIAASKNGIGIQGVSDSRIKIMPLKVMSSKVSGFVYNGKLITDVIADAMNFAIKNGAKVINLSLGWPKIVDTAKIRAAFELAEAKNVVVVAASGNNNKDLPTFPCIYDTVICVGAIDNQGNLSDFSNHGSKVDLVAPGSSIVSTLPRDMESRTLRIKNYELKNGSSQAAPFVSGIIATGLLFNNQVSVKYLRHLIFLTSIGLKSDVEKFVNFGRVSMKNFVNSITKVNEQKFIRPLLKNITEIKFTKDKASLKLDIPFEYLNQDKEKEVEVCLKSKNDILVLESECQKIVLTNNSGIQKVSFLAQISDLNSDAHQEAKLLVNGTSYVFKFILTRELINDQNLIEYLVSDANFDEMAFINADRKLSKMIKVIDRHNLASANEYFYLDKNKQTKTETVIAILSSINKTYQVRQLPILKVNKVLSVHRKDINLDGKTDYMIYSLSEKKDELILSYFDENLNPLFKNNSDWFFPISLFEGLPIDGGIEKFEFVKKQTFLGLILVPQIFKEYELPESDNSKVILERVLGKDRHLFYLNPILSNQRVELDLRAIDSVKMTKLIRQKLNASTSDGLEFLKILPQNASEVAKGTIKVLLTHFNTDFKKYYEITFYDDQNFSLRLINTDFQFDDSIIYPVASFDRSNSYVLTSLLSRNIAEFFILNQDLNMTQLKNVELSFDNPVINLISMFQTPTDYVSLVETRYSIVAQDQNGDKLASLPVYRDSSFPGQNFSETLVPVFAEGKPGVFINSTLIVGDRLYVMTYSNNQLVRPAKWSVSIPTGCVPLQPEVAQNGSSTLSFLCSDSSKRVYVKQLPLIEE